MDMTARPPGCRITEVGGSRGGGFRDGGKLRAASFIVEVITLLVDVGKHSVLAR